MIVKQNATWIATVFWIWSGFLIENENEIENVDFPTKMIINNLSHTDNLTRKRWKMWTRS